MLPETCPAKNHLNFTETQVGAYWACNPSKALLRPPEALTEAREVNGSKQATQGQLSVESTLTRRDTFVDN
jgi:dihydrolipoamide dehydrogenase